MPPCQPPPPPPPQNPNMWLRGAYEEILLPFTPHRDSHSPSLSLSLSLALQDRDAPLPRLRATQTSVRAHALTQWPLSIFFFLQCNHFTVDKWLRFMRQLWPFAWARYRSHCSRCRCSRRVWGKSIKAGWFEYTVGCKVLFSDATAPFLTLSFRNTGLSISNIGVTLCKIILQWWIYWLLCFFLL